MTSPWNSDVVLLWREGGELKKCVWEMPQVIVLQPKASGQKEAGKWERQEQNLKS